jgi:uncharacterized protein YbjT (DUF2867 family)
LITFIALLDTRDIAATAVAALTEEGHAGKIYDLNGPELPDGYAQSAVFSSVLGRPVKYLDVTADAFIGQLAFLRSNGPVPLWVVQILACTSRRRSAGREDAHPGYARNWNL